MEIYSRKMAVPGKGRMQGCGQAAAYPGAGAEPGPGMASEGGAGVAL